MTDTRLPHRMYRVFRIHLIEDAVTPYDNKVVFVALDLELRDIRVMDDYVGIAANLDDFGF